MPLEPEQIPEAVADFLRNKSALYVKEPPLEPAQFDELLFVANDNGVTSYIARQDKTYDSNGRTERLYHVVDADAGGEVIGYAEIRLGLANNEDYFKDKPFVGSLWTDERYRRSRRGNLAGRLVVLAALAEQKLELPLYTDTVVSKEAHNVADKLARNGRLELIQEDGFIRYRTPVL